MQLTAKTQLKGTVEIKLYGPDGNLKLHRIERNMIVAVGLTHLATRCCSGNTVARMDYIAIGSNNTAVTSTDTALGTELARVQCSTNTATGADWSLSSTFGAGIGTGNVYEAGVLDAAAAGNMLCRLVFGIVTKEAADTLIINWTVSFADDGV